MEFDVGPWWADYPVGSVGAAVVEALMESPRPLEEKLLLQQMWEMSLISANTLISLSKKEDSPKGVPKAASDEEVA